jgi:hypothetical protein
MIAALTLLAGLGWAAPAAPRPPEETLRALLAGIRAAHAREERQAILGSASELRDAVTSATGAERRRMSDRLPGMAADPFNLCRDLASCPEAPLSLHAEDQALLDDAFVALARPWFALQKARGQAVSVKVEPGVGVELSLSGVPDQPVVVLEAEPAPTGGFDVVLREGRAAAAVYARERAAVLAAQ